jgi:hypothetical protein
MSNFQLNAFENLSVELVRESEELRKLFDARAEVLARSMVEVLRLGEDGVELLSCQVLPDGLTVQIRFRAEGWVRTPTISGGELVRLFLSGLAEETFPC